MESQKASVSLNGVSTTASSVPHYLRRSTGSCHDICNYGSRRRPLEERPTKTTHKRAAKHSNPISTQKKRDVSNQTSTAGSQRDAKSISPKAKTHSPRSPKSVEVKPPCLDGNRRRNSDVHSGRNTKKIWIPVGAPNSPSSLGRKTAWEQLSSPRKDQKRVEKVKNDSLLVLHEEDFGKIKFNNGSEVNENTSTAQVETEKVQPMEQDQIKIVGTETQRNEFQCDLESVTENLPSSSHRENDEESDKSVFSHRKRNRNKRRKRNGVIKSGNKCTQPTKLKFRIRQNSVLVHEESNIPRRHKFRRTEVEGIRSEDYVPYNQAIRMNLLRTKENNRPTQNRRMRVRYGKTKRILVLENRKDKDNATCLELQSKKKQLHHHVPQRKNDVQVLFNAVIEETLSKLAERRKGTVKSLVGAFETLISLQARQCLFRLATVRVNC